MSDLDGLGPGGGGAGRGPADPANPDDLTSADFLRTKYPEVYKRLQKDELGFISESKKKMYLFCYNLFMFCGFLLVAAVLGLK